MMYVCVLHMKVYPKVPELATRTKNGKY